jgi:hypothetical protein
MFKAFSGALSLLLALLVLKLALPEIYHLLEEITIKVLTLVNNNLDMSSDYHL